jgi:hypothetical protein
VLKTVDVGATDGALSYTDQDLAGSGTGRRNLFHDQTLFFFEHGCFHGVSFNPGSALIGVF